MLDTAFEAAFRHLFVYNVLFEDAEVDGRYFELDRTSRVLGISAAGCGLASMVRFAPRHIDAVDINSHHLALAALKMTAAQKMSDYRAFYRMFGHGTAEESEVRGLAARLPAWMRDYWARHHRYFRASLYGEGLTARMFQALRIQAGLGTEWMQRLIAMAPEERKSAIRGLVEPGLRKPLVASVLRSPLQLLALGVNFSQRDRLLAGGDIIDYIVGHIERVAETDCETNWFAWLAVAGHYNHNHQEAVPPYLREVNHEASRVAPTTFSFHRESIFNTLAQAGPRTWTHYSLCDAVDWMPRPVQSKLFQEIVRTAEPGAIVLMRSVEERSAVEQAELGGKLVHLGEQSARATVEERSKQYRRVDFYRVCA